MISIRIEGAEELAEKFKMAGNNDFKEHLKSDIEALSMEFLELVQDEIISTGTVDTRRLLASFNKGSDGNIYELRNGGLTVEVGTNVEYASYVNDGHFTNPQGVATRWVPGSWSGSKFRYEPGNRQTGMLLRQQWVDGTNYWDTAVETFRRMFGKDMDDSIQTWIDEYFN